MLPKKNYILNYRSLKYYLKTGWKLTKVHNILEFKQSDWMKAYIEFNTQKRIEATNESDKNFFKLMINSAYGKTMENMRKRMKIRIVNNEKDCIKYSSRPTFKNSIILGRNLIAINEKIQEIKFDKPIYDGCTVIEDSKLEMYKFWYDFLKKQCKDLQLIYMDTDSFLFEIKDDKFEDVMLKNKEYFDLSNYSKDSKYYDATNKKVPGKMKNERPNKEIKEAIALKSKSYIDITNDDEECKHKEHNFTANDSRNALFNDKMQEHPMSKFISVRHNVFIKETDKRTLYTFCEKKTY